jgi:hypothetical protein
VNHTDVEILGVGVAVLTAILTSARRLENRLTKLETWVEVIKHKFKL